MVAFFFNWGYFIVYVSLYYKLFDIIDYMIVFICVEICSLFISRTGRYSHASINNGDAF